MWVNLGILMMKLIKEGRIFTIIPITLVMDGKEKTDVYLH